MSMWPPILLWPPNHGTISRLDDNVFRVEDTVENGIVTELDIKYMKSGGSWVTVTQSGPNTTYLFAADTFTDGDYQWQASVTDQTGGVNYSSSWHFTVVDPPAGPSFVSPASGASVSTSPLTVTVSIPSGVTSWAWQILADDGTGAPDPSTVLDVGVSGIASTVSSFTVDVSAYNGMTVHVQAQSTDGGVTSDWIDLPLTVDFDPAPTPTVILAVDGVTVQVQVTNPAPSGDETDTSYNNIWVSTDDGITSLRWATGQAPNTTVTYMLPAFDQTGALVDHSFMVEAVTAGGVSTFTGWVGSAAGTALDVSVFLPGEEITV